MSIRKNETSSKLSGWLARTYSEDKNQFSNPAIVYMAVIATNVEYLVHIIFLSHVTANLFHNTLICWER